MATPMWHNLDRDSVKSDPYCTGRPRGFALWCDDGPAGRHLRANWCCGSTGNDPSRLSRWDSNCADDGDVLLMEQVERSLNLELTI